MLALRLLKAAIQLGSVGVCLYCVIDGWQTIPSIAVNLSMTLLTGLLIGGFLVMEFERRR